MAAGAVFGQYRLIALLGRGGMGEVWRALDTRKDRQVALKVLGSWLGAEPGHVRRFQREAALAARLNAPNIIPIHDYGEIDGRLFIDMPLIDGEDLEALLAREGPLPPRRAVGIVDQVADALDVAHEAGLVHRDVKPSNVLITTRRGKDFVYLIDFGIARLLDSTSSSQSGSVVGTLGYMAPERFEGEGDRRGDVYALACVLHAALTGQPPFAVPSGAFALGFYLDAHRSQAPPRPSRLAPGVPAELDAVIARGMAKQPADRYRTAGDLAGAAHHTLASVPAAGPAHRFDLPVAQVPSIGPATGRDVAIEPSTADRPNNRMWVRFRTPTSWKGLSILAVVALLTFLLQAFGAQVHEITSGSMEITLHGCTGCTDDRVLVSKIAYWFSEPRAGDVVVFRGPDGWTDGLAEQHFIDRVIAVGGQTVKCCDARNRVLVDGKPLDEPYIFYLPEAGPARQDSFGPVTVPAGSLWLMGDSRNNSADSRVAGHGAVPVSDVIGEAWFIFLPFARFGPIPAPDPYAAAT